MRFSKYEKKSFIEDEWMVSPQMMTNVVSATTIRQTLQEIFKNE